MGDVATEIHIAATRGCGVKYELAAVLAVAVIAAVAFVLIYMAHNPLIR